MTVALARALRNVALLLLLGSGCGGQPASPEQCALILDRIVDVELGEQGFHDLVLAARKKAQLRSRFHTELEQCPGRPLRRGALACVSQAKSSEEISHTCLH